MQELPSRNEFVACHGETFRIHGQAADPLELELIEVTAARGASAANGRPFSLLFRGPAAIVLPQKTYEMEHARLGTLAIFIVPIRQDADGVRYEAVFN